VFESNLANSMANEIRNTVFLSTFFAQKYDEAAEKVGSARLHEPRDLYSAASLQHSPKWPIECQVSTNISVLPKAMYHG